MRLPRRPRRTLRSDLGPLAQLRAGRLPRRLTQLVLGLLLFGFALAMIVVAGLGTAPWDVLHLALAARLPVSLGTVVIGLAVVVLLLWIPLQQRPGVGTATNAVLVGLALDLGLLVLPADPAPAARVTLLLGGVLLNGIGSAAYLGTQLGPGTRDGLMTGLARVTGRSLRVVRTAIEVSVVAMGVLLGGPLGLGTALYALAIGPLTQFFLPWFVVELPGPRRRALA